MCLRYSCVQTVHAIRILRSHGMDDAPAVTTRLPFSGDCKTHPCVQLLVGVHHCIGPRQRLEGFLRHGCRQNLYSADKPSITQLIEETDDNLFNKIRYNPSHPLHHLLPRQTDYSYSLRSRSHNFELMHTHDNRNFIDRNGLLSVSYLLMCYFM